ncbi:MDR family oxidoreductase [Leifsonia sp. YAF41]|uniref:MDR family oxidoreductase n=1 Tax=Leifsonia sp. YAF41 TaxID=3233086 RepID=UPI003F968CFE
MSSTSQFRALVVDTETDAGGVTRQTAELRLVDVGFLAPGDVTIDVQFSSINYKDGLALCGKPGVVRTWPLIAGIDIVGVVTESAHPEWKVGDTVIQNGAGLGERLHGGLAARARVDGTALVRLPEGLTALQAAAIGTAGFTAMLAVMALQRQGVTPESGPVLVTGAAGGVGSVAISLLAGRGFEVHASTGRGAELGASLHGLGATQLVDRADLAEVGKPLQTQRWAAVVDSVGSATLANALAQTNYGGVVAACGLAQGADLPTTVLPFILRAVILAGINSVDAPTALRAEAWELLAEEIDVTRLEEITHVIPLDAAIGAARRILSGDVHGRTVVDVNA